MSNGAKVFHTEKIISISKTLFVHLPEETVRQLEPYFCGEAICPPKVYFELNDITEKLLTGKGK